MDDIIRDEDHLPAHHVRLPERGFAIDRRKALIASAICWTGWAIFVWLVLNDRTGDFDRWGLLLFRDGPGLEPLGGHRVEEAVRDVTALGGIFLGTLATLGAIVALLFLRMRREAVLFGLTWAGGWAINNTMKWLVGRERPELVPRLAEASGNSFPSGHSFSSAMIYIGMALAFASISQRHSVRYTIIVAAMVLSGMIAWSRVMLGVHFPSDVVAGWLGGAGWAFLAAALFYFPAKAAADSEAAHKLDPTERARNSAPEPRR